VQCSPRTPDSFSLTAAPFCFYEAAKESLVPVNDEQLIKAATNVGFYTLARWQYLALTYLLLVGKAKLSNYLCDSSKGYIAVDVKLK
jgi:hypothetical protein